MVNWYDENNVLYNVLDVQSLRTNDWLDYDSWTEYYNDGTWSPSNISPTSKKQSMFNWHDENNVL